MVGPEYEPVGLVAPSLSIKNRERSALRAVLLSVLAVSAVLVIALTRGGSSTKTTSLAADPEYPPPAYPAPAVEVPAALSPEAPPAASLEEASGEEAPAAAVKEESGGSYSGQGYGNVGPAGTITTGCKGGSCAESGPTSASEGLDDQVADYEKLKSERRQALDFCDAHFSSWVNIQKCISELFRNARY